MTMIAGQKREFTKEKCIGFWRWSLLYGYGTHWPIGSGCLKQIDIATQILWEEMRIREDIISSNLLVYEICEFLDRIDFSKSNTLPIRRQLATIVDNAIFMLRDKHPNFWGPNE
jgi:hypothetical protein